MFTKNCLYIVFTMKHSVRSKLYSVFGYPMFRSVGGPLPARVKMAGTWSAAMKHATSTKWEHRRLDARNILQQLLEYSERDTPDKAEQLRRWGRRDAWGKLGDELAPIIDSFLTTMIPGSSVPPQWAAAIKVELSWYIFFICIEEEYSDLVEPPFYLPFLDPWYASGHFPCGWEGKPTPEHWAEKEIPYLNAKRVGELWGNALRQGRLVVF